jgi:solute carrier family 6 amino acid transporter-like protein 5/7/9/14
VTLEGAGTGILYYLKPDFSRLSDARAWSDAATQIFFSLSTCTGGLIAMASYNPFKNNCLRDSIMIPIINCGTSFYAGFAIFSVLGYMAHQKGVTMADVAASGPGLVFVVFPEGLSTMPIAPLWSILFFIMMMTLGLSSEFSIIECFFSGVLDEFPYLRKSRKHSIIFRLICCTIFYLIGLSMVTNGGFYLFNLFDYYVGGFPLLVVGFFECVAINYIYGYKNFADDIKMMIGKRPTIYIRICWCVISPLILLVIIIFMSVQYSTPTLFSNKYIYPSWAEGIGWLIVATCIFLIPVWFLGVYFKDGGWQLLKKLSKPSDEWGPAHPNYRIGKYAKSTTITTTTTSDAGHNGKVPNSNGITTNHIYNTTAAFNVAFENSRDDEPTVIVTSFRSDDIVDPNKSTV